MIVIGDVHGCYKTLMKLIDQLPAEEELCFLGDLIDRGPDSKKVIEFVMNGGHRCVLGNHEDMALQAYSGAANKGDHAIYQWLMNGGNQCLESYNGKMPSDHLEWFAILPYKIEIEGFVMSHSNIAAEMRQVDAKTYTIWNRDLDEFLTDGRINVFGHTPEDKPIKGPGHIRIDTGCVFGQHLTGYCTETDSFYQQLYCE